MIAQLRTVIPVWVAVAVAALLIGLLPSRGDYLQWLSITMACAILLTFCIQLAIVQRPGLVNRMVASIAGAIIILAAATGVLGLLGSA